MKLPYHENKTNDFEIAELGEQFYYEYVSGIVIPVTVNEITDIISPSIETVKKYNLKMFNETSPASVWVSITEKEVSIASSSAEEIEGGWNKPVELKVEDLEGASWANQFVWLDEIIGHSISLDELNRTLGEAMSEARRCRFPRHPEKKLRSARHSATAFVNSTHTRNGHPPGCPLITTEKPVYVKRSGQKWWSEKLWRL